jgi:hypothetical protein
MIVQLLRRSQADLWGNADADACDLAALATRDPMRRALLVYLGEFWLELARHDTSQISKETALDIATIEQMQWKSLGVNPTFH